MEDEMVFTSGEDPFCKAVNKLVLCRKCFGNSWGVCDMTLPSDKMADSWDRIMIEKKSSGRLTVETDIEFHYADEDSSPEARFKKMKQLEELVKPVLPEGANLLRTHEHGDPNSNLKGLHIHAFYNARDLPDAARMAKELGNIINPPEMEKKLGWQDWREEAYNRPRDIHKFSAMEGENPMEKKE